MPLYQKTPEVIEAITFDDLVEYGRASGANIVNGMPWSFQYSGKPITHENDDRYLVSTELGMFQFNRGQVLIIGSNGYLFTCDGATFARDYEPVVAP